MADVAQKQFIRIELETESGMGRDNNRDYLEYLLSPVLAVLETQGLTAINVELFDEGEYDQILKDQIALMQTEPRDIDE